MPIYIETQGLVKLVFSQEFVIAHDDRLLRKRVKISFLCLLRLAYFELHDAFQRCLNTVLHESRVYFAPSFSPFVVLQVAFINRFHCLECLLDRCGRNYGKPFNR